MILKLWLPLWSGRLIWREVTPEAVLERHNMVAQENVPDDRVVEISPSRVHQFLSLAIDLISLIIKPNLSDFLWANSFALSNLLEDFFKARSGSAQTPNLFPNAPLFVGIGEKFRSAASGHRQLFASLYQKPPDDW